MEIVNGNNEVVVPKQGADDPERRGEASEEAGAREEEKMRRELETASLVSVHECRSQESGAGGVDAGAVMERMVSVPAEPGPLLLRSRLILECDIPPSILFEGIPFEIQHGLGNGVPVVGEAAAEMVGVDGDGATGDVDLMGVGASRGGSLAICSCASHDSRHHLLVGVGEQEAT